MQHCSYKIWLYAGKSVASHATRDADGVAVTMHERIFRPRRRRTDNQQERFQMLNVKTIPSHIGYYLAGFTDGEGSFNISFRPRPDYQIPWKVSACFNISQKDKVILALFKRHLQCGTLRARPDGVWYYEVNNLKAIAKNVIPFFERFGFLSSKKKNDFQIFKRIVIIMENDEHLTKEGIAEIVMLRNEMNDGGRRKYSDVEIMKAVGKSSETIRQTAM